MLGQRERNNIVRLKQDEFYLVSAGAWTDYDADFLMKCAEDKSPDFVY